MKTNTRQDPLSDIDTSSISFTALYTGYVWYQHGLSDEGFATSRGRNYYRWMQPLELGAKLLVGSDVKTTLLQRHAIIDRLLRHAIEQESFTQVLEIACGLSPRGHRFMEQYHDLGLRYVEADLPQMAARKRRLLENLGTTHRNHKVCSCNILDQSSPDSLEQVLATQLDANRRTLVITEGLVNYFSLPTISSVWQRLANGLRSFPQARYLTDIYPAVSKHPFYPVIRLANTLLATVSRSDFTLHFSNHQEIEQNFRHNGFQPVRVHDPADYFGEPDVPRCRLPTIVRVIEADVSREDRP